MQALQDATGIGDLTPQPKRFTMMLLGYRPFLVPSRVRLTAVK
jgi:hypothetical protein